MITFSKLGSFGRLGNQLFQISAAVGLAKRNNTVARFNKWDYSEYFKNPINQDLNSSDILRTYTENGFHYSPIHYSNGMDLVGYFQSEKYFSDCKDLIRRHFDFIDSLRDGAIDKTKESCSIHIRRGDYLNLTQYHPVQSIDYYDNSIRYMRERGVTDFYVFSDDINWCRDNLQGEGIHYISGNSDIKDLCLMSECKNNIIANSSFSWWGAWLNNNPSKIVIAPSGWFGPAKRGVITDDLYCENWIIL